ncbi:DUF998 domain-containing protein [Breznakiella homolactica]|uniref:DUF998 domain-containing protein n=1 Tax=Breznakiella homolactica TaxID=2798577 RepID=A0A7T8B8W6_9SPIR|nr:DUF998 domain-containing protein [Breznakiella homolactica]QQO07746.1 DUF998 domain-containing protein [Breznakiella homolactica]
MDVFLGKSLWIALLVVLPGDFLAAGVLAPRYPGYSHRTMVMSVLGSRGSPVRLVYNLWLIILGLVMILGGLAFFRSCRDISLSLSLLGAVFIIAYGTGAGVLSGLFSADGTGEQKSIPARVHGISAGTGFMLLAFLPLVIALLFIKKGAVPDGLFSLAMFVLCLVFFTFFVMSDKEKFRGTWIDSAGLWQRILLGVMYAPLFLLAAENVLAKGFF